MIERLIAQNAYLGRRDLDVADDDPKWISRLDIERVKIDRIPVIARRNNTGDRINERARLSSRRLIYADIQFPRCFEEDFELMYLTTVDPDVGELETSRSY